MGVRRRAGEAGATQQWQVGPVVADHGERVPIDAELGEQWRRRRQLVADAVERMRNTEIGDAAPHRRRIAAGDDQRQDAAARQQLQAVAVERARRP